MTREQRVRDLIAIWQPRLGLRDWDIRYLDIPEPDHADEPEDDKHTGDDEHDAVIYRDEMELCAQIYIALDTPDEYLECLVIHELLHAVLIRIQHAAFACAGTLGDKAGVLMIDQLDNDMERAINQIATAITGIRPMFGKRLRVHHLTAWEGAA